jgi:hypothetical protein
MTLDAVGKQRALTGIGRTAGDTVTRGPGERRRELQLTREENDYRRKSESPPMVQGGAILQRSTLE